jgi:hypothetical protein
MRLRDFWQHLCADIDGLHLHAAVRCAADDRQALARLCRYITRPALTNERVQRALLSVAVLTGMNGLVHLHPPSLYAYVPLDTFVLLGAICACAIVAGWRMQSAADSVVRRDASASEHQPTDIS